MLYSTLMLLSAITSAPSAVPDTWFEAYLIQNKSGESGLKRIDLVNKPDRAQVAAVLSQSSHVSYRVKAICKTDDNGILYECRPQELWPNKKYTFLRAKTIFRLLKINKIDAASAKAQNAKILVTMYLDDEKRQLDRSCPPGWCAF